jgi:hypothetical protein
MRYDCPCGGSTIKVSRHLVGITETFLNLGFVVSEAYHTIFRNPDSDSTILLIEIWFDRTYPREMFQSLPTEYFYQEHEYYGHHVGLIILNMGFFNFGKFTPTKTLKILINFLQKWLHDFETSGAHGVYTLAGFI